MKLCSVCGESKPLGAFNKHRRQKDGFQPQCRECSKAGKVKWRKENADRVAFYERNRRPRVKQEARRIFRAAVAAGKLARPEHCSRCGKAGKIQGHHRDYSKPLIVVWLCATCHAYEHRLDRLGDRKITPRRNP